jgi:hypothetical protein
MPGTLPSGLSPTPAIETVWRGVVKVALFVFSISKIQFLKSKKTKLTK